MRMRSKTTSSSSLLGAIIFADACGGAVFEQTDCSIHCRTGSGLAVPSGSDLLRFPAAVASLSSRLLVSERVSSYPPSFVMGVGVRGKQEEFCLWKGKRPRVCRLVLL